MERQQRRLLSFRPSYQGWKQVNLSVATSPGLTFRPSYQGWKLVACGTEPVAMYTF